MYLNARSYYIYPPLSRASSTRSHILCHPKTPASCPSPLLHHTPYPQSSSTSSTLGVISRFRNSFPFNAGAVSDARGVASEAADTSPALAAADFDVFDFDFFFFSYVALAHYPTLRCMKDDERNFGLTSCHPHTGRKLSKNPTSSNRFGYSHNPGGTVNTVAQNRMSLKMAMAKNSPISPSPPMLRYHTPIRSFTGQSGNITTSRIAASAPPAYSFCFHCGPSYSQT